MTLRPWRPGKIAGGLGNTPYTRTEAMYKAQHDGGREVRAAMWSGQRRNAVDETDKAIRRMMSC